MIDITAAKQEFLRLKTDNQRRNDEYFLLRQAVQGNFRWPRNWPDRIPKLTHNLCKPITERYVTYLIGKGFTYNIDRPNTLEYREAAERAEKILRKLLKLSKADLQFLMGAQIGSQLGRTVYKVYKKGTPGSEHACFQYCQPDYFYGVNAGDDRLGEWSTVYYSYPMDKSEAIRTFGKRDFKDLGSADRGVRFDDLPEFNGRDRQLRNRMVPVLEVWNKDDYAIIVGEVVIFNGPNPYKDQATGEGFIPFVVIENIRNAGAAYGESDINQSRELNEWYNQLISRKAYIVQRYLNPTIKWEGAPPNYAELLANTTGGGGVLPTRLGARIEFLTYDRANPAVLELEQTLRRAIIESAGMNEQAMQGTITGSINTGPALQAQFQPVLSSISKKRREWEHGLERLFYMLLELQEQIGDSKVLGSAVVNPVGAYGQMKSQHTEGQIVPLSGKDISGLRDVTVTWPDVLPKDDEANARMQLEFMQGGIQSIYTTLEKLGVDYPDDEIARIRMENQDPSLKGQQVAEQMRAQTPLIKAQMDQQMKQQELSMQQQQMDQGAAPPDSGSSAMPGEPSIGDRLRMIREQAQPTLDTTSQDFPVIQSGF